MKRDYYEVLGVPKNADQKQIKHAYRRLAKQYHPDTNQGNKEAEQKFKEITEAYEILSDEEKRKQYDQFGFAAFDGSMGNGAQGQWNGNTGSWSRSGFGQDGSTWQEFHYSGGNMDDIFDDLFGHAFHRGGSQKRQSGGSTFHFDDAGFGGGFGENQRNFAQDGKDVTAQIRISFDDVLHGGERLIHLKDANGKDVSLKVSIPVGIDTGQKIRLKGKGEPGRNGGKTGDLLLEVTVDEKPGFERKGRDVYTTIQIPYTTAVLGGEAIVKTLYGNVKCKIAAGTQSGTKIRLKGKGMPVMHHPGEKGDQYAVVEIQVPKHLNARAKEKLMEFQRAMTA